MKYRSFSAAWHILTASVLLCLGAILMLSGCKGRTANDMTPTGDTVEVVINTTADSVLNSDNDSLNNEN